MRPYEQIEFVSECVSCKRCYPDSVQFCTDCLVELTSVEVIPYIINKRYRLERVISRGAIGIVFSASDIEGGPEVAIKVVRASVMADPRAQDRFCVEARIALDFHHPQIGAVYDFGFLPDASAFVVSEYVKGTSLRSAMKRTGKFDVKDGVAIIAEVCEALHAAHLRGLVHRDLKPESIILIPAPDQPAPNVKIVDFSVSKIATGKQFVPGTTGKLQGKGQMPLRPTYLSPEQFRGEDVDLRSDIYSLGVITYEMLGGQPPFTGTNVSDFGAKLLNSRPPSLRSLNPEVNIVLEAEILTALEKYPADRQQRALEFRRGLLNASHFN
jgi:eukaryotic-like serine/threonine-protein kinase